MNPLRYKTLLTYLPGMAPVVNSFASPQVQVAVYQMLIEALDVKLRADGLGSQTPPPTEPQTLPVTVASLGEMVHELVEGDSIHNVQSRKASKSTSTVF